MAWVVVWALEWVRFAVVWLACLDKRVMRRPGRPPATEPPGNSVNLTKLWLSRGVFQCGEGMGRGNREGKEGGRGEGRITLPFPKTLRCVT